MLNSLWGLSPLGLKGQGGGESVSLGHWVEALPLGLRNSTGLTQGRCNRGRVMLADKADDPDCQGRENRIHVYTVHSVKWKYGLAVEL